MVSVVNTNQCLQQTCLVGASEGFSAWIWRGPDGFDFISDVTAKWKYTSCVEEVE